MTARIHISFAGTIAAALVIASVAPSAAGAGGSRIKPSKVAHYGEPGSTGWVPTSTSAVATTSAGKLDWTSAVIGGGVVLGLVLVVAGAMTAFRKASRSRPRLKSLSPPE